VDDTNVYELFSTEDLFRDIQRSVNATGNGKEKVQRHCRDRWTGFPGLSGEQKKARHLQSSASLLFNVFSEYEPNNLLLRQAYSEVFAQQMEEARLRDMLHRIQQSNIIIGFRNDYHLLLPDQGRQHAGRPFVRKIGRKRTQNADPIGAVF
jgi:ATP-dependent Lhr-like helicase